MTCTATWLRCPDFRPRAAQRLVCFPHAGGSAPFFRDWGRQLPDVAVHAVQYPGRADRTAEPVPTDLVRMARDVAAAVTPLCDRPVALFGHSMGALLAFEVARLLEARGIGPSHLFVSAARAPHDRGRAPERSSWDDDKVMAALVALGGSDAELLSDAWFRALVMPYLIGDFRMYDSYRYRPGPRLRCPVTSIVGDADPLVSPAQAGRWGELTRAAFRRRVLPGGHFYLTPDPPLRVLEEAVLAPLQWAEHG